jgi:hypothetical protein
VISIIKLITSAESSKSRDSTRDDVVDDVDVDGDGIDIAIVLAPKAITSISSGAYYNVQVV